MRKTKVRYDRIVILVIVLVLIIGGIFLFNRINKDKDPINNGSKEMMINLVNKDLSTANFFANQYNITLNVTYKYDDNIPKDNIISQDVKVGTDVKEIKEINIIVSKGKVSKEDLKNDGINEIGSVPIMMYHNIKHMNNSDTKYTGGNVDKDGYNRTTEAFRNDLEFYYKEGYRMIRLADYVNGDIDVSYGKSPIIITFDDGNDNNILVKGLDDNGDIIIDENSAVGILESFKKKYPDYNVTATFFVNDALFNQKEYNDKILKWLVSHGYDVGNHTKGHPDFTKISSSKSEEVVGYVYKQLESIIPGKYVNIVALPFGSPYKKTHPNFSHIMSATYEGVTYNTEAALRVGWEGEVSPFNKNFDPTFLKRIRAYDNNGKDFDIEMNFNILKNKRYVSDGDKDTIVIKTSDQDKLNTSVSKTVITY